VQRALLPIVARRLAHDLEWSKGHAQAEVMLRREFTGLAARPQGVGGRIRLLQRTWPDRDRPVLEVTTFLAKRMRLRPGFQDQLHAFRRDPRPTPAVRSRFGRPAPHIGLIQSRW
jgi:hypothetical protein